MSENKVNYVISFLAGMLAALLLVLSIIHARDTAIIKMYVDGKIECATIAEEFICVKKENNYENK